MNQGDNKINISRVPGWYQCCKDWYMNQGDNLVREETNGRLDAVL